MPRNASLRPRYRRAATDTRDGEPQECVVKKPACRRHTASCLTEFVRIMHGGHPGLMAYRASDQAAEWPSSGTEQVGRPATWRVSGQIDGRR